MPSVSSAKTHSKSSPDSSSKKPIVAVLKASAKPRSAAYDNYLSAVDDFKTSHKKLSEKLEELSKSSNSSKSAESRSTSARPSGTARNDSSVETWANSVPSLPLSVTATCDRSAPTNSRSQLSDLSQDLSVLDVNTSQLWSTDSNPRAGMFSDMSLNTSKCSSCSTLGNFINGQCKNEGCMGDKDNSLYVKEDEKKPANPVIAQPPKTSHAVVSSISTESASKVVSADDSFAASNNKQPSDTARNSSSVETWANSVPSLPFSVTATCDRSAATNSRSQMSDLSQDLSVLDVNTSQLWSTDSNPRAGMFSDMSLNTSGCSSCSSLGNFINGQCKNKGCMGDKDNSVYLKENKKELINPVVAQLPKKLVTSSTDTKDAAMAVSSTSIESTSNAISSVSSVSASNVLSSTSAESSSNVVSSVSSEIASNVTSSVSTESVLTENPPKCVSLFNATGEYKYCCRCGNYGPDSPIHKYLKTLEDVRKIELMASVFEVLLAQRAPHILHLIPQLETLKWQLEKLAQFSATGAEKRYLAEKH